MNAQEKTQDRVTSSIDATAHALNEMSKNETPGEKIVISLGSFINDYHRAQAEKINELSEELRKVKTSSNIGAIASGVQAIGFLGYLFLESKKDTKMTVDSTATGEMEE